MNGPRRRSLSAARSARPQVVAIEYDSSRPDSRRPVVSYRVLGQDEGLVPQNSWNRVRRFQPSMSAFFRWGGEVAFLLCMDLVGCMRELRVEDGEEASCADGVQSDVMILCVSV